MIGVISRVIQGEGVRSAMRRASERFEEAAEHAAMRMRGTFRPPARTDVLTVSIGGISPRLGGVQTQLLARMESERHLAILTPRFLQTGPRRYRVDGDLFDAIRTFGARTVHFEGTFGLSIENVIRLVDDGFEVIVSVHDYSLVCDDPHLLDAPISDVRCAMSRRLLERVAVIFPSKFLRDHHRQLLSMPLFDARVVEPRVRATKIHRDRPGRAIAFAGSVSRHKGAHLLPDVIRACNGEVDWHIFGGGDVEILRALRRLPRTSVHGYYRAGTLPRLLASHDVGLAVLPSIWPEAFLLTMSEAWLADVPVATFDLGAPAERIREHGGGWVTPLERGASGLIEIVRAWERQPPAG